MKRLLSRLLIFAIIFTMLPAGVWASEETPPPADEPANLIVESSDTIRTEAGERENHS